MAVIVEITDLQAGVAPGATVEERRFSAAIRFPPMRALAPEVVACAREADQTLKGHKIGRPERGPERCPVP